VASVTATVLTWATFGRAPLFSVPPLALSSPWEMLPHAVLGLVGGGVAAVFLLALRASADLFARSRLPRPAAMALAALVVGVVTLWFPEVVGNGRDAIAALFLRDWTLGTVVALLLVRLVVTPLTVGSGAVGGVFTPTLFIGAMLGQAFGGIVARMAPGLHAEPGAYALTGMACLLAGTTHAPMTATLMVFEMTLDYHIVVPLLLGSAIASVVATRFNSESVYTEALQRKAAASDGTAALRVDALTVADLMRQEQVVVAPDCAAPRLFETFDRVRRNHVYVVEATGRFVGAVNLHDLNAALRRRHGRRTGPDQVRNHRAGRAGPRGDGAVRAAGMRAAAGRGRCRVTASARHDFQAGYPVSLRARSSGGGRPCAPRALRRRTLSASGAPQRGRSAHARTAGTAMSGRSVITPSTPQSSSR
jgi:CIC family chloride channel protein